MDLNSLQQYVFKLFESILNGLMSSGRISLPESSNISVHFQNNILPIMVKQIAETHFRFNPYTNTYEPVRQIDQNLLSQAIMQEIDKTLSNMRMSGTVGMGGMMGGNVPVFSRPNPVFQHPAAMQPQPVNPMGNSHISSIYGGGNTTPTQPATMFPTPTAPMQACYEIKSTPQTQYDRSTRIDLTSMVNTENDEDIISTLISKIDTSANTSLSDYPVRNIDLEEWKLNSPDSYIPEKLEDSHNFLVHKKFTIINDVYDCKYLNIEIKNVSFENEKAGLEVAIKNIREYMSSQGFPNMHYFATVKLVVHNTSTTGVPHNVPVDEITDTHTTFTKELLTDDSRADYKKLNIEKILRLIDRMGSTDIPCYRTIAETMLEDMNNINRIVTHHIHPESKTYCVIAPFKRCYEFVEIIKNQEHPNLFGNSVFLNRIFKEIARLIYQAFPDKPVMYFNTEDGVRYLQRYIHPYYVYNGKFLIAHTDDELEAVRNSIGKALAIFSERVFHITNIPPSKEVLSKFKEKKRYTTDNPKTVLEHLLDRFNHTLLPVYTINKNGSYYKYIAGRNFEGEFTSIII